MIMKFFLIFFHLWFSSLVFAEDDYTNSIKYPIPEIQNYPPSVNGGYTATWGISQGKNGNLYFANSYGLLIYDGKKWESVVLDNEFAARSIDIDNNGNIIVGSLGDFGFISNDGEGLPIFKSLKSYYKKDYKSKDIIYETFVLDNDEIFFRSNNKLFFYKDKLIQVIDKIDKNKFGVSRYLKNNLYVSVAGLGIAIIENKVPQIIPNSEIFKDKTIAGYHLLEDGLIVFTRSSGVYKQVNDKFIKIQNDLINDIGVIYRTFNLIDDKIALATYEGLYIFDSNLEPDLYLNSNSGLRDDNVRSVFEDKNGNIWLGLNDGISKINVKSKFKYFPKKDSNLIAKTISLEFFNKHLYVSTSSNLKKLIIDNSTKLKQTFQQVAKNDLNTQVWDLFNLDSTMLIASNDGLGQLNKNDEYSQLIEKKITGRVYEIMESKLFTDYLYVRAQKGIFLLKKENTGNLKLLFDKRASYIQELPNRSEIWFFVAKKGVHKVDLNSNKIEQLDNNIVTIYDKSHGINTENTKIFKIDNSLIFKSKNKLLKFDRNSQSFNQSKILQSIPNIENKNILKIEKTNNETYWINTTERKNGKRVQDFYELSNDFEIKKLPFNALAHHLAIKFYFKNNLILMRGNEGIVLIDPEISSLDENIAMISSIKNNDATIHDLAPQLDLLNNKFKIKNSFNYDENKISFEVSISDFRNENINQFRYRLDGFEEDYSLFTKNNIITYTNLNPGSYTFLVQGLDSSSNISKPSSYSFSISYPWWQTKEFYLIEFIIFSILLFITLFLRQTKKGVFIATSLSFMMILVLFEFINFTLDPLILIISNGVPVFSIISKVILGVILLPLERLMNKILDFLSTKISFISNVNKSA